MRCGYKFSQPEDSKWKRLKRALIVGNAVDAFEDIPVQEKGQKFLLNDWNQGPFYAWDQNYLRK